MKKSYTKSLGLILALVLFSFSNASAQLPKGSFGVGANFGVAGSNNLQGVLALSEAFELGVLVGFSDFGFDTDSLLGGARVTSSMVNFGATAKFILGEKKAKVNPFVQLAATIGIPSFGAEQGRDDEGNPTILDVTGTNIGFSGMFGAQAKLVDNVFIHAGFGLNFSSSSTTVDGQDAISVSVITTFTSAVGLTLYLD